MKKRLDILVVERGLAPTTQKAQAHILAGEVLVDGKVRTKAGESYPENALVDLRLLAPKYVSRGGHKLEAALQAFRIDPTGKVALDIGASTGGFTDCLLQHGAARVIAVDVGHSLLHERLRGDPRVEIRDRTNARTLAPDFLAAPADLIVIDVSFIALGRVLGPLRPLLAPGGALLALIKPQFEAPPAEVPRGGVIRDAAVHERVLAKVRDDVCACGFRMLGLIPSPITGADGNQEFLAHLVDETASLPQDAN